MILFFDTETTGFVHHDLPLGHPDQPHLVQLAALLCQDDGTVRGEINLIVEPFGYEIPEAASRVHGITTEIAQQCGVPLIAAAFAFFRLRAKAHTIVAHNIKFDGLVMDIEQERMPVRIYPDWPTRFVCTMESSAPIINIPPTPKMLAKGMTKPKNPTMMEAYNHFFGHNFEGAHDAMADVIACKSVFFKLQELGVV